MCRKIYWIERAIQELKITDETIMELLDDLSKKGTGDSPGDNQDTDVLKSLQEQINEHGTKAKQLQEQINEHETKLKQLQEQIDNINTSEVTNETINSINTQIKELQSTVSGLTGEEGVITSLQSNIEIMTDKTKYIDMQ